MRKSRFSETLIVKMLMGTEAGRPTSEIYRKNCISSIRIFKGKSKYGGMEPSGVRHLAPKRQASESIKQTDTFYQSIVENQTELISIYKSNGICIFVNNAFCRFFGQSKEHFIGNYWHQNVFSEDIPSVYDRIASLTPDNPVVVTEYRAINGSGEVRWIQSVNKALFNKSGTIEETRAVGRDITEQKQKEKLKDDVERMIRHDIKTPLASLIALTHLISKGRLNEQLVRHLPRLYNAVRQIAILMDSKEKIEKMERGTFIPQTTQIKFIDIYQNISSTLADILAEKNIALTHRCDDLNIYGDEFLVENMFQNIIKNVIALSPPNNAVTILHRSTTSHIFVDICIKETIPQSIKDAFFEKQSTNIKDFKNSLGAYHAWLIAKAHGGHIIFTASNINETTLTVKFPAPTQRRNNQGNWP